MAVTLSNVTYPPTKSISKSLLPRKVETDFGDGYRQITADGINYKEEEWNVLWIPMDATDALALETILDESIDGTDNYLYWTPPGESTAKYYTAYNIYKDMISFDKWQVSATLRREFILA